MKDFGGYMPVAGGFLEVEASSSAVTGVRFIKTKGELSLNETAENALTQLAEYFAGKRAVFSLPLAQEGTDFERSVWKEISAIPAAARDTYSSIAARLKNSKAARAVGTACGKNRIAVIIPCHRVLRTGGGLGGYAYGLDKKNWLLEHERKHYA